MRPRTRVAAALLFVAALAALAQTPAPPKQQPRNAEPKARQRGGEYTLTVDVDHVVLHASVTDKNGRVISGLKRENFRVYEDNAAQEVSVFYHEDVPVTVGLVLDNSGSMTENKPSMMAGALRFAETSNPRDEVFVVNFKDDYYLDLGSGKDFTSDLEELQEALAKTTTGGNTSLWDAISASLGHLRRGTHQKKVLLILSDGVDSTSSLTFNKLLGEAQQAETALYFIGLPCGQDAKRGVCRKAKRDLRRLAEVTGGVAYFPVSITEVEALCRQVAHDIRNQYILAYYPTNSAHDGSFRAVRVEVVNPPKGAGKLFVRARTGYYSARERSAGS